MATTCLCLSGLLSLCGLSVFLSHVFLFDRFVFSGVLVTFVAKMGITLSTAKSPLNFMLQIFQEFQGVDDRVEM